MKGLPNIVPFSAIYSINSERLKPCIGLGIETAVSKSLHSSSLFTYKSSMGEATPQRGFSSLFRVPLSLISSSGVDSSRNLRVFEERPRSPTSHPRLFQILVSTGRDNPIWRSARQITDWSLQILFNTLGQILMYILCWLGWRWSISPVSLLYEEPQVDVVVYIFVKGFWCSADQRRCLSRIRQYKPHISHPSVGQVYCERWFSLIKYVRVVNLNFEELATTLK